MNLPVQPPYFPMEAKLVDHVPPGVGWMYEPKWDGFRCLAFRDGEQVYLQSKSGQPLARYFPELVSAFAAVAAKQFVIDGEIAVPVQGRFSFDDLLQRIHPAASRVKKLATDHPATFIAFDLLVDAEGRSLVAEALSARRTCLEKFASKYLKGERFRVSPFTTDLEAANSWLSATGGDLDGIVAKRADDPYRSGERSMQKVKLIRTADCVVGGFRYAEKKRVIGSLLLGLYNDHGMLDHVGFCSAFKSSDRAPLTQKLETMVEPPGFTGHAPGGPSRWSTKRSMEWEPLKPILVGEFTYDHFTGGRFRHGTRLLRWRPDKAPEQCTFDQVQRKGSGSVTLLDPPS